MEISDQYLDGMNEAQKQAVAHDEGPALIIAGAGTGKTTVITRRIAYLIGTGKAKPTEILALTFTEKAAQEMEERVDVLLPMGYVDLPIHTFHGFAEKMLRENGSHIGIRRDFLILDDIAALMLMRENSNAFEFFYYRLSSGLSLWGDLYNHFQQLKDSQISVNDYQSFLKKLDFDVEVLNSLRAGASLESFDEATQENIRLHDIGRAYATYERLKAIKGSLDFGDLMVKLLELVKSRPALTQAFHKRFKYLLIDEFQDTNLIQYEIIKALLNEKQNLMVVGDDDQAIYRFRGASLTNLLTFVQDFPQAKKITLVENYRSRQEILDAAHEFISKNNPHRLEARLQEMGIDVNKKLKGLQNGGQLIELAYERHDDEAYGVAAEVLKLKEATPDMNWSDIAILVRANASGLPFVQAFEANRIPYRFYGQSGLYAKRAIVDILSLFRVATNHFDALSLHRVLTLEALALDQVEVMRLFHEAKRLGRNPYDLLREPARIPDLSEAGKAQMLAAHEILENMRTVAATRKITEAALEILHLSKYLKYLQKLPEALKISTLGYIEQFFRRLQAFESQHHDPRLIDCLLEIEAEIELGEEGNLKQDAESGPDVVKIMTIHGSKGLEFDYVFISHLVEQRFPAVNRARGIPIPEALKAEREKEPDEAHLHEERRLMYVALTRARRRVFLTRALSYGGERKKKPSRFLVELGRAGEVLQSAKAPSNLESQKQDDSEIIISAPKIPSKLSFTQMAAFNKCPLQYKFAHIYKIPAAGNASQSYGKSIHGALEVFFTKAKSLPVTEWKLNDLTDA